MTTRPHEGATRTGPRTLGAKVATPYLRLAVDLAGPGELDLGLAAGLGPRTGPP